MQALKDAAIEYASRGWQVFPCHSIRNGGCSCGNLGCKPAGKHPRISGGHKNATRDQATLERWWTDWPDANIGVATGEDSNLVVLDVDGSEGMAALEQLEAKNGKLPETVTARTGKGVHYYFQFDQNRPVRSRAKIEGVPIDVRAIGGYVIAPPSNHKSGFQYEWVRSPGQVVVVPAPGWLLDYLTAESTSVVVSASTEVHVECEDLDLRTAHGVREGGRHQRATQLIGAALGRGADPVDVIDWAYDWAERCAPPMDRDEVKRIVKDFVAKDTAKLIDSGTQWKEPWPVMGSEAFIGLAGEFVQRAEPQTEADPNALLVQFLALAGMAFGRNPHYLIEATRHTANLFAVVVGDTGEGRKGTGFERVKAVFPTEVQKRVTKGLSSGEGLIHHVRDPQYKKEATRKQGVTVEEKEVLVDEGVTDKRVLAYESEFASVLSHMKRDTNVLSNVLRQAWEGGDLNTMTKNSPTKATGAHVSVLGNITKEELGTSLTAVDGANGFANRFLWVMSKRSKLLPFGGSLADLADLRERLATVLDYARTVGEMQFNDEARVLWEDLYRGEFSRSQVGLFGKVTSRRAPQTIRMAMIFAVLNQSEAIRVEDLRAAVAVWRYCEQSARYIFGNKTGDPVADRLFQAVRERPMKLAELHRLFSNHHPAHVIRKALQRLADQGLVECQREATGGRPSEVWRAA